MIGRPRYGALGMITMPYAVAQLAMNLVFLPVLLAVGGLALAHGDWKPAAQFAMLVLVMHTVIAVVAVIIARERPWHLLVVPIYRPIYEAMRVYLLYACAFRVIKGAEFAWDKLERRNTVVASEESDGQENGAGAGAGAERLLAQPA
jgi:biofilm PGA synthesis N-glycosyltransferase PgaC